MSNIDIKPDIIKHIEEYKEYRKKKYKHNKENNKKFNEPPPSCSNKMCLYFFNIAKSYLNGWCVEYSERDDMIQFAVLRCIQYANNCNVEKDMFAYFTEIIKTAFKFYLNNNTKNDTLFNEYKEFMECIYSTSIKGNKHIII